MLCDFRNTIHLRSLLFHLRFQSALSTLSIAVMASLAQMAVDLLYSLTNCVFCFPNSPNLKVNNKSFKLLRLLGEVSAIDIPLLVQLLGKRDSYGSLAL